KGDESLTVHEGHRFTTIDQGNDYHLVKNGNAMVQVANGDYGVNANKAILLEATNNIRLRVGNSEILISPDSIQFSSKRLALAGADHVGVKSTKIDLN